MKVFLGRTFCHHRRRGCSEEWCVPLVGEVVRKSTLFHTVEEASWKSKDCAHIYSMYLIYYLWFLNSKSLDFVKNCCILAMSFIFLVRIKMCGSNMGKTLARKDMIFNFVHCDSKLKSESWTRLVYAFIVIEILLLFIFNFVKLI